MQRITHKTKPSHSLSKEKEKETTHRAICRKQKQHTSTTYKVTNLCNPSLRVASIKLSEKHPPSIGMVQKCIVLGRIQRQTQDSNTPLA